MIKAKLDIPYQETTSQERVLAPSWLMVGGNASFRSGDRAVIQLDLGWI